jgi:4-hydroxy-tetrahydrodipicolinate reductase
MSVIVVGSGKLAQELLGSLRGGGSDKVLAWADVAMAEGRSVVVHAGSGRELDEVIAYCQKTGSPLVELATGSALARRELGFPVVLCANTNILMLKFMAMLARSGQQFKDYDIKLIESHQAAKSSTPGTAVALAQTLGLGSDAIVSVRDPQEQRESLGVPPEHLARHAFHRIVIEDRHTSITLETRVFGPAPYAEGLTRIISAIGANPLENRRYDVIEFVERGWI